MANTTLSFDQPTTVEYNKARFGFDEAVHNSIDLLFSDIPKKSYYDKHNEKFEEISDGPIRRALDFWESRRQNRLVNFLVLGCKDGDNDFIYILEKLEEISSRFEFLTFHLVGIEILETPQKKLIEKIKDKGYNEYKSNNDVKSYRNTGFSNINLYPLFGDIEKYNEHDLLSRYTNKWGKFDFIFSFYVIHHLVNVPMFLDFLYKKLLAKREIYWIRKRERDKRKYVDDIKKRGFDEIDDEFKTSKIIIKNGTWYNLKADTQNPVGIIENNSSTKYTPSKSNTSKNLFDFVKKYHLQQFKNHGISYDKIIKASDTDILHTANMFLKKEKEYEIRVKPQLWRPQDFRNIFSFEAQYAPFRWGIEYEKQFEKGNSYFPFISIEGYPDKAYVLDFSFKLEEYSKIKSSPNSEKRDEMEDYNKNRSLFFQTFLGESYRKNRVFSYDLNEETPSEFSIKTQSLILQRVLGSGGIKPNTRFATVIDKTSIYSEQDFADKIPPFVSICRAKEDANEFKKDIQALRHLLRHYGSVFDRPQKQSLTSIIFKKQFEDYKIWIVKKSNQNLCKIIPLKTDSSLKVVYIEVKSNNNKPTITNGEKLNMLMDNYLSSCEVRLLQSFYLTTFKDFTTHFTSKFQTNEEDPVIFQESGNDDSKRELSNKMENAFYDSGFEVNEEKHNASTLFTQIAERIQKYNFWFTDSTDNNCLIYVKNTLDTLTDNTRDLGSIGGIVLGEKTFDLDGDGFSSFEESRLRFLHDFIDEAFLRFSVPIMVKENTEINEKLKKISVESAVSKITVRDSAHHMGSHVSINSTNFRVKNRLIELIQFPNPKKIPDRYLNYIDVITEKQDKYEIIRNEYCASPFVAPRNMLLYKDVICPMIENVLLMDNIGKSESACYLSNENNKIKIRVNTYFDKDFKNLTVKYGHQTDGRYVSYPEHFPYDFGISHKADDLSREGILELFNDKTIENDIEICQRTEHALYLVIEGVLRNAIKHHRSDLGSNKELNLNLTLLDGICDGVRCDKDEQGKCNGEHCSDDEKDFYIAYLYPTITEKGSGINFLKASVDTIKGLVDKIDTDIIGDEENTNLSLGITSLKISAFILGKNESLSEQALKDALELVVFKGDSQCLEASYLMNGNVLRTENQNRDGSYIVNKSFSDELSEDTKYGFGYRFLIPKAKKVRKILGHEDLLINQNSKAISSYNFALIDRLNNRIIENLEKTIMTLPSRILINQIEEDIKKSFPEFFVNYIESRKITCVQQLIELEDDSNLEKNCWEQWLKRWDIDSNRKADILLVIREALNNLTDQQGLIYDFKKIDSNNSNVIINHYHLDHNKKNMKIFYDSHSSYVNELNKKNIHFYKDAFENFDSYFHENIGKRNLDFTFINQHSSDKILMYKMIEAANLNVLVFDERVLIDKDDVTDQEKLYNDIDWLNEINEKKINKKLVQGLLSKCFVGTHFNDSILHPSIDQWGDTYKVALNFNEYEDKWELTMLPDFMKNTQIDVLIIHRTLLNNNWTKDAYGEDKKLLKLFDTFPHVVVISGGGAPHSIKGNYKFMSFNTLESYWAGLIAKIQLSDTLLTLTKK